MYPCTLKSFVHSHLILPLKLHDDLCTRVGPVQVVRVRLIRIHEPVPVIGGGQLLDSQRLPDNLRVPVYVEGVFQVPARYGVKVDTLAVDAEYRERSFVIFDPVVSDEVEVAAAPELLHENVDAVINVKLPLRRLATLESLGIELSVC